MKNLAEFSVGGSNCGEVGGGQCKRLVKRGFRCKMATTVFGHMQHQVMAAATQNGAASKELETQGCGLFIALERWIEVIGLH